MSRSLDAAPAEPFAPEAVSNVVELLDRAAAAAPARMAVAEPRGRPGRGPAAYRQVSFQQLAADSHQLALALRALGATPGTRLVLMVRPGIDFIALVFALLRAGIVAVLIDPGMGRRNLLECLEAAQPEGFIGIPLAQAARCLYRSRFPHARLNVTVGARWFWGGPTLAELRRQGDSGAQLAPVEAQDPAAIIFTSGSTGVPKGVLYRHGNFARQVTEIQSRYDVQPGEIDLPCFPLFGLFNAAMGVSTVVPRMDATRPADVDPRNILAAVADWQVTQSFGSPALWNTVGRYCERRGVRLPTLRRVLSAGAPVPVHVLKRIAATIGSDGQMHTPYGATEALPVATISAREVLEETAERSQRGEGTCVGRRFAGIRWKVIDITDGPLETMAEVRELPAGQIGELIVQGPVVTVGYVTRPEHNPLSKIADGALFWHRMGDVGYLDDQDRFWFCGRKSQRVLTADGPLFTVPCEAIANGHPDVYRSALVGVRDEVRVREGGGGCQTPLMVVETWPESRPRNAAARRRLLDEVRARLAAHPLTRQIQRVLWIRRLPVDIRHNSKIFREQVAEWAQNHPHS